MNKLQPGSLPCISSNKYNDVFSELAKLLVTPLLDAPPFLMFRMLLEARPGLAKRMLELAKALQGYIVLLNNSGRPKVI